MTTNDELGGKFPLSKLFDMQSKYQKLIAEIEAPIDDVKWFQYHIAAMVEELGELLKSDKRWKTHRNFNYNKEEKLEEMADVFITVINLALYSGFDVKLIFDAIEAKIKKNVLGLEENRNVNNC